MSKISDWPQVAVVLLLVLPVSPRLSNFKIAVFSLKNDLKIDFSRSKCTHENLDIFENTQLIVK